MAFLPLYLAHCPQRVQAISHFISVAICVAEDLYHPSQSGPRLHLLSSYILVSFGFVSQHRNPQLIKLNITSFQKSIPASASLWMNKPLTCMCSRNSSCKSLLSIILCCTLLTEALTTLTHHDKTFKSLLISSASVRCACVCAGLRQQKAGGGVGVQVNLLSACREFRRKRGRKRKQE